MCAHNIQITQKERVFLSYAGCRCAYGWLVSLRSSIQKFATLIYSERLQSRVLRAPNRTMDHDEFYTVRLWTWTRAYDHICKQKICRHWPKPVEYHTQQRFYTSTKPISNIQTRNHAHLKREKWIGMVCVQGIQYTTQITWTTRHGYIRWVFARARTARRFALSVRVSALIRINLQFPKKWHIQHTHKKHEDLPRHYRAIVRADRSMTIECRPKKGACSRILQRHKTWAQHSQMLRTWNHTDCGISCTCPNCQTPYRHRRLTTWSELSTYAQRWNRICTYIKFCKYF